MNKKQIFGIVAVGTGALLIFMLFFSAFQFKATIYDNGYKLSESVGKSFFRTIGSLGSTSIKIEGENFPLDSALWISFVAAAILVVLAAAGGLIIAGVVMLCKKGNTNLFIGFMTTAGSAAFLLGVTGIMLVLGEKLNDANRYLNYSAPYGYSGSVNFVIGAGSILMIIFGVGTFVAAFVLGHVLKDKNTVPSQAVAYATVGGAAVNAPAVTTAYPQDDFTRQIQELQQEIARERQRQELAELRRQLEEIKNKKS